MKNYILKLCFFMTMYNNFLYCENKDGIFDFVASRDFKDVADLLEKNAQVIISDVKNESELENFLKINRHIYSHDDIKHIDSKEYGSHWITKNPNYSNFFTYSKSLISMAWIKTGIFDGFSSNFFYDSTNFDYNLSLLFKSNTHVKVFRKNGKVIGLCCYYNNPELIGIFDWYIDILIIDKNHQRQGYGTLLLEYCINNMLSYGADFLTINLDSQRLDKYYNNNAIISFYKKNGFLTYDSNAWFSVYSLIKILDNPLSNNQFQPRLTYQNLKKCYKLAIIFRNFIEKYSGSGPYEYLNEDNNIETDKKAKTYVELGTELGQNLNLTSKAIYEYLFPNNNNSWVNQSLIEIINQEIETVDKNKKHYPKELQLNDAYLARRKFKLEKIKEYIEKNIS